MGCNGHRTIVIKMELIILTWLQLTCLREFVVCLSPGSLSTKLCVHLSVCKGLSLLISSMVACSSWFTCICLCKILLASMPCVCVSKVAAWAIVRDAGCRKWLRNFSSGALRLSNASWKMCILKDRWQREVKGLCIMDGKTAGLSGECKW